MSDIDSQNEWLIEDLANKIVHTLSDDQLHEFTDALLAIHDCLSANANKEHNQGHMLILQESDKVLAAAWEAELTQHHP